jgi:hypothetical protein
VRIVHISVVQAELAKPRTIFVARDRRAKREFGYNSLQQCLVRLSSLSLHDIIASEPWCDIPDTEWLADDGVMILNCPWDSIKLIINLRRHGRPYIRIVSHLQRKEHFTSEDLVLEFPRSEKTPTLTSEDSETRLKQCVCIDASSAGKELKYRLSVMLSKETLMNQRVFVLRIVMDPWEQDASVLDDEVLNHGDEDTKHVT